MRHELIKATALSFALLLCAGSALAADSAAPAAKATAQAAEKAPAGGSALPGAKKAKQNHKAKLVDINSASKKELKTLPGIGDAEADRIIAGRPYGSKVWLVSHKILPGSKFPAIRDLIIAKQHGLPIKPAAKAARP